MIKSDSLVKIAPAILAAQKEMGAALKDSKNPFFKSSYADLGAVIDATVPAFNAKGISVLQNPCVREDGTSVLQTMLLHESGEFIVSEIGIVTAKQNDPQSYGSAVSYARRYGLQSTATIKTQDDDANSAQGLTTEIKTSTVKATEVSKITTAPKEVVVTVAALPAKPKLSFSKKTVTPVVANTGDDI